MLIRCARAARDGSIYIYGLAEHADGGGWSLIFQVDEDANEGYSVSSADGATSENALMGWRLTDHDLELRLTASERGRASPSADALRAPRPRSC